MRVASGGDGWARSWFMVEDGFKVRLFRFNWGCLPQGGHRETQRNSESNKWEQRPLRDSICATSDRHSRAGLLIPPLRGWRIAVPCVS